MTLPQWADVFEMKAQQAIKQEVAGRVEACHSLTVSTEVNRPPSGELLITSCSVWPVHPPGGM